MSESTSGGAQYQFSKGKVKDLPDGVAIRYDASRVYQDFDSLQAALALNTFCGKHKINQQTWANIGNGTNANAAGGESWFGIVGGVEAVRDAITHGWPAGVRRMREAMDDLGEDIARPRSVRRARIKRDHGQEVDMQAMWRGRADIAWTDCTRQVRTTAQVITIAANITALRHVDASALFWRGAAVLKLADMLTEAGYNVRIVAVRKTEKAYQDHRAILQRVTVKEPTAPLDMNALASTVCLSGFFRVVLFLNQCAVNLKITESLGNSEVYTAQDGEIAGVERCMSREAARQWVIDAVAQIDSGGLQQAA